MYIHKKKNNSESASEVPHRRNQSEPFRPAGDSRTGLQRVQCLGPSSGTVSCGRDNTAGRPHTPYPR